MGKKGFFLCESMMPPDLTAKKLPVGSVVFGPTMGPGSSQRGANAGKGSSQGGNQNEALNSILDGINELNRRAYAAIQALELVAEILSGIGEKIEEANLKVIEAIENVDFDRKTTSGRGFNR